MSRMQVSLMMTANRTLISLAVAALAVSFGGCDADSDVGIDIPAAPAASAIDDNQKPHYTPGDLVYDESEVVEIILDGTSASADADTVSIVGSTITITAAGVYSMSGPLTDGEVIVEAGDDDEVVLILDGVDITNLDGAAIAVMNANEATFVLVEGSTNRLTDGPTYTFPDAEADEPNATLYSTADLTIVGDGELIVIGNYNDGITSKDGLVIGSGTITVTAADDGIRGKDYVVIEGGIIGIVADGDGIIADNEEDAKRGYVLINDGSIDITAGDDGVQGATDVLVAGGSLRVDAGSGSGSGRALQGDVLVVVSGGVVDAKAVDDAIHSNDQVIIGGGELTLAAGDDGIHGDYLVTVMGGSITIVEAFEGIESEVIVIQDGFIDITSNDDGLNVASAEAASMNPGGGPGSSVAGEYFIYIEGGTTVITITDELNEQGDGIDANGYISMTGGVVAISGATDTRNSALDYDGRFELSGGLLIGTNIDGRNSQGAGTGSTQASLYVTTGSRASAGTVVHIQTSDGEGLVTFEPANDYNVIIFSSPDLVDGQQYDVYLGGTVSGNSATHLYEGSAYTLGEFLVAATASP